MRIEQQELLKTYMHEAELTRSEFCARFKNEKVTIRALDSWLLPVSSAGFRAMPNDLYKRIADDLTMYLDEGIGSRCTLDYPVDESLISFDRNGTEIYFPNLYLLSGYYEVPESSYTYLTDKEIEALVNGRNYMQELSFSNTPDSSDFVLENSQVIKNAIQLNGENYWFYITQYDTAKEAMAALEIILITQDDEYLWMNTLIGKFKGSYFLWFINPAPKWYDEPLIIYGAKSLTKMRNGQVVTDHWQQVIDKHGNTIEKPSKPA